MVDADVLAAVVNPKVHDARVILSLAHSIGDITTTFGVLDPEIADALIGVGQREAAALGMREAAAVEVQLGMVGFGPVDPALKILYGHFIAVHDLAFEITVYLVQVQTVVTRNQAHGHEDIRPQLIDVTSSAGEIACALNTATEGTCLYFEAFHIIGLPTMQGEVEVLHLLEDCFGINSDFCVALLGYGISLGKKTFHIFKEVIGQESLRSYQAYGLPKLSLRSKLKKWFTVYCLRLLIVNCSLLIG